jgi:hypothetical protein
MTWSGLEAIDPNSIMKNENFNSVDGSQTSFLTLKPGAVIATKSFTCTISSERNLASDSKNFDVVLSVYGECEVIH